MYLFNTRFLLVLATDVSLTSCYRGYIRALLIPVCPVQYPAFHLQVLIMLCIANSAAWILLKLLLIPRRCHLSNTEHHVNPAPKKHTSVSSAHTTSTHNSDCATENMQSQSPTTPDRATFRSTLCHQEHATLHPFKNTLFQTQNCSHKRLLTCTNGRTARKQSFRRHIDST